MKAFIIAAGFATRLHPLTLNQPKALLPIKNKPILNYIIEKIEKVPEVDRIYIVSNEKFYLNFKAWLDSNQKNSLKPIFIFNEGSTSAEHQKGVIDHCVEIMNQDNINDDLLILYGDNFFSLELNKFAEFFKNKRSTCLACYALSALDEAKKFGNIKIDQNNKIIEIKEKPQNPESNLAVTGIYLIKKDDLNDLRNFHQKSKKENKLSTHWSMTYFILDLYLKKDVYAFPFSGDWIDIGSKEDYKKISSINIVPTLDPMPSIQGDSSQSPAEENKD